MDKQELPLIKVSEHMRKMHPIQCPSCSKVSYIPEFIEVAVPVNPGDPDWVFDIHHYRITLEKGSDEQRVATIRYLIKNHNVDLKVAMDLWNNTPVILLHYADAVEAQTIQEDVDKLHLPISIKETESG